MQGQHSRGVAYYRCRYPSSTPYPNKVDHPRNVIMREETLIRPLDTWLAHYHAATPFTKLVDRATADIVLAEIVVRADQAAFRYSWRTPRRRSHRRMSRRAVSSGSAIGTGNGYSGRALAMP